MYTVIFSVERGCFIDSDGDVHLIQDDDIELLIGFDTKAKLKGNITNDKTGVTYVVNSETDYKDMIGYIKSIRFRS